MIALFTQSALLIFTYMTALFCIALMRNDNSIVDVGWGAGFILLAYYWLFSTGLFLPQHLLVTGMITVWGLRLSTHIFMRNWGRGEDPRYKAWRKQWGAFVIPRSFLQIFMLQGVIMLVVAYPILVINSSHTPGLSWLAIIGFSIWLTGFLFESISDYQLYTFITNPQNTGAILTSSLWRYTRHPNYFGEVLVWWGIFLVALSVPYGATTIISPLIITYLLVYVSGIPMTEALFKGNQAYVKYKQQTSIFFPWFPKK